MSLKTGNKIMLLYLSAASAWVVSAETLSLWIIQRGWLWADMLKPWGGVILSGGFMYLVLRRISAKLRQSASSVLLPYTDPLTNLPNATVFYEKCRQAIEVARLSGQRVCILYIEFDRWKLIHDTMGRKFGNLLMKEIAAQLAQCAREGEIISRGELHEFKLLIPQSGDVEEAVALAQAVLESFEQPLMVEQFEIYMKPRVGIAMFPDDGAEVDTLLRSASIAANRAKETGSGLQFFDTGMFSKSLNVIVMEHDMRKALLEQQFELVFQPQYCLRSRKIVGMEALIRWRHPVEGMIAPGQFISLAEETGLIVPIGEWVIEQACRQNKQWQEAGAEPITMAVNLSIRQFLQSNISGSVARILQETGLEAPYLELEITESMAMDVDRAVSVLVELKKLGVKISMDDFGTGYSSLTHLKKFPIDCLKIDKSFIQDIHKEPSGEKMIATIISMAHSMELSVIAEGVETTEQLQFLEKEKCDAVQGFLLKPPVSAAEAGRLLQYKRELAGTVC